MRFLRPRVELRLLPSACFWLCVSWLALDVLPGRLYRFLLSPRRPVADERGDAELTARVRSAVMRAARRVPWRTECFHAGIAAHQMLRRRGVASTLNYGIKPAPEGGLCAHVWVISGDSVVVGGNGLRSGFTKFVL